ncbi:hypothetical protein TKK_0018299 [Trichogramma kaykai]|uniref:C2H2-type domain-containing protein n=1 Tax=Trichogramma kaykai TaxID=54128 RepID=A0ABD2VZK6_9HYME
MAPLSRALSGVILPYDFYGNHLDSKKECVDKELELKNFAKAGETLSEIWSEMEIDKFPVLAKYITPDESLPSLPVIDYSWHQKHVRESQYFLQIVKCDDRSCCTDFRSDVRLFLHDRFFPPPLLYKRHENDGRLLIADPLKDAKNASFFTLFKRLSIKLNCNDPTFKNLPYDYHCSTVQDILQDRICPFCGLYFASLKNVKEHRKIIHPAQRIAKKILKKTATRIIKRRNDEVLCVVDNNDAQDIEWLAIEEVINADSFLPSQESEVNTEDLPIIESIKDWLKCDWEEVN